MDPWWAKGLVLAGSLAIVAIRAPHGQASRKVPVALSHRGPLETALLALAWLGFFAPFVWVLSSALARADYPLRPAPFWAGAACIALGLWLFHRSHADLGRNWSITLELRERHALVTHGVYRRIRHPMYSALLLYSAGQALALPNWIAGPSYLVTMALLFALRVGPEERMMRARFGREWDEYAESTRRLVPLVW